MTSAFPSLLVFFPIVAACGASVAVPDGPGAGTVAARDASSDAPLRPDAAANDGEASRDTCAPDSGTAGKCATAEPGSCVECCRLPAAPNYGGFELYAYELCEASPACSGFSPCGTNSTPPGARPASST